jgi:phosphoribosylanthranilate isomerase
MPGVAGLDVNSRFETVPGVKDVALLGELSEILNGINYKELQR